MVAARRVPIPRRVAEEKLPLPLLAWSSAPGAITTLSTRVSTSSTRGADVEMDTHPSVDIEGYPVGEARSMMVDGLPFHALLMNTGTDQGTLLIASQSDTKSSLKSAKEIPTIGWFVSTGRTVSQPASGPRTWSTSSTGGCKAAPPVPPLLPARGRPATTWTRSDDDLHALDRVQPAPWKGLFEIPCEGRGGTFSEGCSLPEPTEKTWPQGNDRPYDRRAIPLARRILERSTRRRAHSARGFLPRHFELTPVFV